MIVRAKKWIFQRTLFISTEKHQATCAWYVPVATIVVLLMGSTQQSAFSKSVTCIICVDYVDECCLELPTRDTCLLLRLCRVAMCSKSRSIARLWVMLLPVSRPIHSFQFSGLSSFIASTGCASHPSVNIRPRM